MKNTVYLAQSLDGYIAGPDGELEWLHDIDNPEGNDFGFARFMDGVDALIMGKNTFATVCSFGMWPYTRPVYVASRSLDEIPPDLRDKAFILNGSPHEMVEAMHIKGFENLYIDGGALVQSFLQAGLIDELIITTIPVVLGRGIRLFGQLDTPVKLTLVRSETLIDQLVKNTYQVTRR